MKVRQAISVEAAILSDDEMPQEWLDAEAFNNSYPA